ncbi:nuclear transport factor 2 family protein [Mycolicibacterium sp. 050232]|uniref:nuclear transport factor 2 family protein n=1 Tax=Mycolicibacterium sp. 050232 TaxID=3113982 RepID=UPI002E2D3C92|nr:nuclear transport factor 2 family protein [Mycolicibacterium sp. 050232]MED5810861.1 nuclear transport factor 2 family protein [Mycolicibacterium sp. 050232]
MTDREYAELVSREQIRSLAYRYAAAIDARDAEAMAELFSPRASFGDHGSGPDGARRLMSASLDGTVFAVILVANHLIEFDGADIATGEVWAHCYAQTLSDGFIDQLIKYQDRYERIDGKWLFAHRRHRLWYGAAHGRSPLAQPAANWPAGQVGVGDVALSDPTFVQWWRKESR